jgi:hypothetical protein
VSCLLTLAGGDLQAECSVAATLHSATDQQQRRTAHVRQCDPGSSTTRPPGRWAPGKTQRCVEHIGYCSQLEVGIIVSGLSNPCFTLGWLQELSTLLQLLDADPTMHEVIHDPNTAVTLLARE